MEKRKRICVTLALAIMGSPFSGAYAQFGKFKSRTNFNNDNAPADSARALLDKAETDNTEDGMSFGGADAIDGGGSDAEVFGRGTGIGTVKATDIDKRYVNLNPETAFGPEVVTSFDFPNVGLEELTKHMQKLTGINLIIDKELKGKISIVAPTPITVGDAWKAYLSALNINGYSLVKSGAFWKIVNARDIRYTPTKIYTGNYTPDTENYVMRIIPLKNISSAEVTRSFRPFMSRYGRIIDIKQTNTVIVQDTGDNINRLVRLIKFIDVPGHEETLQIIPVKHSSAQEISKLLDQILKSKGTTANKFSAAIPAGSSPQSQTISKIIAEPRTNTIIAMANADGARQLRELIQKLDVRATSNTSGQIHVYYLNHGDSEALSKTLSNLVSGAKPAAGATNRLARPGADNSEGSLFNADVKITSDKDNNAIVVTASPTDYITIKEVIKKLDIPRDQVYVEGMMMETNVSKARGFGISILGAYGSGNAQRAGFTGGSSDLVNLLSGNITSLGGLFAGAGIGKSVTLEQGGQSIQVNSVNALITAIASNSDTNVLATPQILALDNTDAVFEMGESVPIVERTTTASGTSESVKQQKVALTLKITPQINKVTRFVKLKIDQKIQDFSDRAVASTSGGGVATVERAAVTTVVVRDRDTIAMGGLMRDRESTSQSKVPLLGDIPVLGWLFKNQRTSVEKVNLLFFLTPRILASYQKDSSANVKDLLNRRNSHIKNVIGEEDPFGTTVKGLYDKAKEQEKGPLYDQDEASKYLRQNEGPGIQGSESEEEVDLTIDADLANIEAPDYKTILQSVKEKKSAPEKEE
jgi:general secretion pathway protein D